MLNAKTFEEKYNLRYNHINVVLSTKKPHWIVKKGHSLYVDEEYLIKFQKNSKRLWLVAHDYYYYLSYVLQLTDTDISILMEKNSNSKLGTWKTFFNERLFKQQTYSIVNTSRSEMLETFIKVSEMYIPKFHKVRMKNRQYKNRLKDMLR